MANGGCPLEHRVIPQQKPSCAASSGRSRSGVRALRGVTGGTHLLDILRPTSPPGAVRTLSFPLSTTSEF